MRKKRGIFSKHELQFILWFCTIFLVSITFLALLGLLPAEFSMSGGETFEQKTRNAIRQIIEGNTNYTNPPRVISSTTIGRNNRGNDNGDNNVNSRGQGTLPGQTGTNGGTTQSGQAGIKGQTEIRSSSGETIYAEEPVRISIPSIGVNSIIKNPISTNYETLDTELTKGVVRYPGSGYPGLGNMFLFGHSTGFSLVQNQAYKVFNRLKDLKNGSSIYIYGNQATYEYKVTSVKKVDEKTALVSFNTTKNMITLSTCDSFGKQTDRFVVEGELVAVVKK